MARTAKPKLKEGDKVKLNNGDRYKVIRVEKIEMVFLENKDGKKASRKNQFYLPEGKTTWAWKSAKRGPK